MSENPRVEELKKKYEKELSGDTKDGVTPLTDFEKAALYQGIDPKTELSDTAKATVKEDKRGGGVKVTQEQEVKKVNEEAVKDAEKKAGVKVSSEDTTTFAKKTK